MAVVPFRAPAQARPTGASRAYVDTPSGRRIAYVERGRGADVVLIHGTLMTADDMALSMLEPLAADRRCIAFDRPGHGWSDHVRGEDASLWSQAATLRDAALALGLRRPVVCGHSFGGAVALAWAMAFPDEVSGAVALAPVCFPEARIEQALFGARAVPGWGDALSLTLGATLDPVMLPALWRAMFLPQPMPERFASDFPFARAARPEQMTAEGENAALFWPDLARSALGYPLCRVPVEVMCGTADLVVNPYLQGAVAAALLPRGRLRLLPGLGHMLHHARPDAVAAAVRSFTG